ncbi:MAG: EAL domain-containing protein [Cycloclasticus sp.]
MSESEQPNYHSSSELLLERERNRAILASLSEGVISTDPRGQVSYINPSAETLLGVTNLQAINKPLESIFQLLEEDSRRAISLSQQIATHNIVKHDAKVLSQAVLKRHDGNEIFIDWNWATILDDHDTPLGVVITFRDISDTHKLTLQLEHQSTHDSLTGLVNHDEFNKRLKNLLAASFGSNAMHSLIYIDLDQFTAINDSCGYQAGDHLLKQISALLQPKVRGRDTLARIGSDKFAVLLENCPKKVTLKIANDLLKTIQDFRYLWGDAAFDIGASLGISYFSGDPLDENNDPIIVAKAACKKAKNSGRNQIVDVDISHPLTPADNQQAEMHWVGRIKTALNENRLVLFQQSIMAINPDMQDHLHFEVLLRMQNKDGELIAPGAFLPVAERYNMINKIDRWVVENTFKWLSENPAVLNKTHLCSINLSALSLSDQTLSDFVRDCFSTYAIECKKICFEVTETSAIHNLDSAIKFMGHMQKLGCSFSLDDFGTGMSSFSYLKHLPVNHLKIDGSFIRDITDDLIDLAMTRSINDIAHVMGMKTIAEFVENEDILQLLKQLGVDYAQGYHIAKPAPLDALLNK